MVCLPLDPVELDDHGEMVVDENFLLVHEPNFETIFILQVSSLQVSEDSGSRQVVRKPARETNKSRILLKSFHSQATNQELWY